MSKESIQKIEKGEKSRRGFVKRKTTTDLA